MKLSRTQFITVNALLCAIVLLFVLVPMQIATIHLAFVPLVAIIISAEFVGLKNGIFTGFFFGLVSLITSYITPTSILYFAFQNPLISIVPRVFIGISAHFVTKGVQKLLPKLPQVFSFGAGAFAGVITNTIGVLGLILLIYYGRNLAGGVVINLKFISAIVLSNSLIEILICTAITPPIVLALKKAFKDRQSY